MKRSPCISLVLLSTLSLVACDSDVPGTRSQYATVQDCVQDWGDAEECEQNNSGGFFGPAVFFDDNDRKHHYLSKKHGKLMPSLANSSFTKSLTNHTSSAFGQVPSAVKVGGFGSSGSLHGASS